MRLDRYAEAGSVFADLSARQIEGHLPEDAAFRLAEIREVQKDYKGAVAVYESLVLKKLAQPQIAWLRLGLAADLAGQPMRSIEALQRVYYDFPMTDRKPIRLGRRWTSRTSISKRRLSQKRLARRRNPFPGAPLDRREAIL
jgi:hypothetical protein